MSKKHILWLLLVASISAQEVQNTQIGFDQKSIEGKTYTFENGDFEPYSNIYEFLQGRNVLKITSSFGNSLSPSYDMGGFGVERGAQTIIIVIDGIRQRSIDTTQSYLAKIPLNAIDSITIYHHAKSVKYGDGAIGGVIEIKSKKQKSLNIATSFGNLANASGEIYAAYVGQSYHANAYISALNGSNGIYIDNKIDNFYSNSLGANGVINLAEKSTLSIGVNSAMYSNTYAGNITHSMLKSSPLKANTQTIYRYQESNAYVSLNLDFKDMEVQNTFGIGERRSRYGSSTHTPTYMIYDSLSARYESENTSIELGADVSKLNRIDTTRSISKYNLGAYLQPTYKIDKSSVYAGLRGEWIKYVDDYLENKSSAKSSFMLYEIGAKHNLQDSSSISATLQKAILSPNVDYLYSFDSSYKQSFVGLDSIKPMNATSISVGYFGIFDRLNIESRAYYMDLKNEFLFDSLKGININVAKSNKLGISVGAKYRILKSLNVGFNYSYVRSVFDSVNGYKSLPGVSPHSVSVGLDGSFDNGVYYNLNYIYNQNMLDLNDYENTKAKGLAYQNLYVKIGKKWKDYDLFISAKNILPHTNALKVSEKYYVYDSAPIVQVGAKMYL